MPPLWFEGALDNIIPQTQKAAGSGRLLQGIASRASPVLWAVPMASGSSQASRGLPRTSSVAQRLWKDLQGPYTAKQKLIPCLQLWTGSELPRLKWKEQDTPPSLHTVLALEELQVKSSKRPQETPTHRADLRHNTAPEES